MDDSSPRRPRARSEGTSQGRLEINREMSPGSPRRGVSDTANYSSPTRRTSGVDTSRDGGESDGMRRRSIVRSVRTGSLAQRTTLAERTQGQFTIGGPEDGPQLWQAHEPFVQPGYSDLNPSYEQAANAKPIWSLAKPLPRVVRAGMVPTKEELLDARLQPERPAENSQKLGLDVNPNDLEQGQIPKMADPRKMAAQVEDARLQRENNFVNKVLTGDVGPSRISRTSSTRRRRPATGGGPAGGDALPDLLALHESTLPDDLHPLVQGLVEDEVHNNHTTWSVIRTHHREALAESLAVFVQLTIGFCADISVTVADAGNPNTTAWAWGFATMMAIYISGGVSGAHLNPSVTIMLWFYRGFPKRKMPEYFLAQFVGAFVAALTAYGVYYQSIHQYLLTHQDTGIVTSFVTGQRQSWIDPATAFFTELLGTVLTATTILALGDDQNAPPGAGMNSLIVGLMVFVLSNTFSYQTGAAFNPSRDFGPRLALLALGYGSELFTNPYWFYGPWAGSLCGAMIGAFLYDFMIFTGGESPVNYPWERTQRSLRKSRIKWKRRLRIDRRRRGIPDKVVA
ncbi:MIP transporter [Aspergillus nomiae NRRL 13137]|uniref:MIP transporter n=1 Tax=Aspergillus nomiae NRRL (strain ATCC 15546 / NRRL 13137 / CBS 260.88 / M93) TaxID=1509407 RepID=A0A0L1JCH3_ASPN3|nr:MIP transporter [Aspergillus nomiae NRRL 13137]KNG89434.1 MIP transporter [Aspergillus nomiae NRRL 13137]